MTLNVFHFALKTPCNRAVCVCTRVYLLRCFPSSPFRRRRDDVGLRRKMVPPAPRRRSGRPIRPSASASVLPPFRRFFGPLCAPTVSPGQTTMIRLRYERARIV